MPAHAQDSAWTLQNAVGAPDNLKISGSFRVRYEALDGQARPDFNAKDDIFTVRTTFAAEYDTGPIKIGAEMYDSRIYGETISSPISTSEVNTFEIVRAYIAGDLKDALGEGSHTSVQVGRLMLNLGSRRLVAADDYRNTTNSYTGIQADYRSKDGTAATFIYVLPQLRLPDDLPSIFDHETQMDKESFDLRLWGGLVSKANVLGKTMAEIGYYRLQEYDAPGRPNRNRQLHTVSARTMLDPAPGRFDFEAEAAYQFGSIRAGLAQAAPALDVSAYFYHVDIGYSFPVAWNPRLSVEYDYASGDGPGRTFGRFDTLFGMRRADFAPSGLYTALGRTNISTPGIRLETTPDDRLDAFASYRALWAAEATDAFSNTGVRDPSGNSGSFAGHQIEGRVRYWIVPHFLRGEISAVWLFKGDLLLDAPNAPETGDDTRYIAMALTSTF